MSSISWVAGNGRPNEDVSVEYAIDLVLMSQIDASRVVAKQIDSLPSPAATPVPSGEGTTLEWSRHPRLVDILINRTTRTAEVSEDTGADSSVQRVACLLACLRFKSCSQVA